MYYPKVSIVIVNWNGLVDTIECLESLKKITYPNYEVTVVDNGSESNDGQLLKEKFGNYIHLIQNEKNYGFATGANIGLRDVLENGRPDYFLLLNNDTVVHGSFLGELVKIAENDSRIGIVGPKVYHYDYKGKGNIIQSAGGRIRWWRPWVYCHVGANDTDLPVYQASSNVDWVTGAALMFNSCLIDQLGLLNPAYFFGHEDVEYCIRARKQGFSCIYVPSAKVWHKKARAPALSRGPILAHRTSYYQFVRHNFSVFVYVYQLAAVMLLLLAKRSLSYLVRGR